MADNKRKNLPGNNEQKRQGKKMLSWLRQELGMADKTPPWYESTLFWGAFSVGGGTVVAVLTGNGPTWLLIPAWVFLCIAGWSAFRGISSRKIRWTAITAVSAIAAFGLVCIAIWRKPAPIHDTFMQPSTIGIPKIYIPLLTPNKPTGFNIGFFNGGQYPAHNVFSGSSVKVANALSRDTGRSLLDGFKKDFWQMIQREGINGIIVDPTGRKWGTSAVLLSGDDIDDIYAGRKFIYVLGYVQWDSSTGKDENTLCIVLQTPEHRPIILEEIVWRTCEGQLQSGTK